MLDGPSYKSKLNLREVSNFSCVSVVFLEGYKEPVARCRRSMNYFWEFIFIFYKISIKIRNTRRFTKTLDAHLSLASCAVRRSIVVLIMCIAAYAS